jgi:M3 family oligoendopeptidase
MQGFAESYQRPDLDVVRVQSQRLAQACAQADSADAFLEQVRAWNRLRATVDTQWNIAMVRYNQDTSDEAARAEQDFWDQAAPILRELDVLHARTLLDSSFAHALDGEFGAQLRALKQCQSATFVPAIKDMVAEEARLCSAYTELLAKPEVEFRDRRMSLSELAKYFDHADRQVRLEAQRSRDAFLGANADALDSTFARLVTLRDQMGKALGHDDYLPLAYMLRSRTCYGPDEVAAFRDAIVRDIVPIATELHARQAADLGLETLLFHDEPVWEPKGNVRPTGDSSAILHGARRMYHEIHPELGEFFDLLLSKGLLDVELRDGKAGGGFCTSFADLGLPFVFANFNGSDGDIMVITHECGHAFQCYSSRHIEPRVEYAFPTFEAAEIHSMGMEFLTYPWMELFFGEGADTYRRTHLKRAICMLPYTAAVDHFQHDVYAHPEWSPDERNQRWLELERLYVPHRDYAGRFPYVQRGTIWQRQRHIYCAPFYYIDYALAQVCAMQIWQKAQHDRDQALADYLAICRTGGSASFLDMLELGDLRSPFDPACIREVAEHIRDAVTAP